MYKIYLANVVVDLCRFLKQRCYFIFITNNIVFKDILLRFRERITERGFITIRLANLLLGLRFFRNDSESKNLKSFSFLSDFKAFIKAALSNFHLLFIKGNDEPLNPTKKLFLI